MNNISNPCMRCRLFQWCNSAQRQQLCIEFQLANENEKKQNIKKSKGKGRKNA